MNVILKVKKILISSYVKENKQKYNQRNGRNDIVYGPCQEAIAKKSLQIH